MKIKPILYSKNPETIKYFVNNLNKNKHSIRSSISGAFHCAKGSGNFGRNSTGMIRFGFF